MSDKMEAIVIPNYAKPDAYGLASVEIPKLTGPNDVLIRVHASSINPVDVQKAAGALKILAKDSFPYLIGYDCAGVIAQIGPDVSDLAVGDAVYARLPEKHRGAWSEYATCPAIYVSPKPASISFAEAASLPLAALTALQSLRRYKGDLAGKTVFVAAGLSGTGIFACQMAKNVFKAGKVITTVSTSKIDKVAELLGEGVVDQIIDYTTTNVNAVLERHSVDFVFDTAGQAMKLVPLVKKETGILISISTIPSGTLYEEVGSREFGQPYTIPRIPFYFLNLVDYFYKLYARYYGVEYDFVYLEPTATGLIELTKMVNNGQVKAIVGATAKLSDLEGVRRLANIAYNGKGAIGKSVLVMADDE